MSHSTTSLPISGRIATLDIIRGVALLGILIMNMPGFSASSFAGADGSFLWPGHVDRWAEGLRDGLFSGKFNSMFSLLFGLGFTIQYGNLRARDPANADAIYLRRIAWLGVFGVIHALIFWGGDILHIYALFGMLILFPLRHASERTIIVLMVICLLYPAAAGPLRLWLDTPEITAGIVRQMQALEVGENAAYGRGSFFDGVVQNVRSFQSLYGNPWTLWGTFNSYLPVAMTMLLGLYAGRRQWAQRIPELMPNIPRLQWIALAVGLACALAFTLIFEYNRTPGPSPIKVVGRLCYLTSRLALMIFYVLCIVRFAQTARGQRWLAPLALVGRMPLTNYLMQTLICITLFYGWGFALWGRVGPAAGFAIAVAIFFVIQVPWSLWWLRRHERGPMEWLWSRLTYRQAQAKSLT